MTIMMKAHWAPAILAIIVLVLGSVALSEANSAQHELSLSGWPVYVSAKHGFSVRYPPGWHYLETPTEAYTSVNPEVWFYSATPPPPRTGARPDVAFVIGEQACLDKWQPEFLDDYRAEPYRLGTVKGTRISGVNKQSLDQELVVVASFNGACLQVLPNHGPESLKYLDQMLSTFSSHPALRASAVASSTVSQWR